LGTLGLLICCLPYAALIIFLLIEFTGLEIEWRGGYLPALTYQKTRPDFDRLERSRTARASPTLVTNGTRIAEPYWVGFCGPRRDGIYDEQPILTHWPTNGLRLLWRQPIGGGYASFAIAEGLAFTIEQRRDEETATAYELETGQEVWAQGWKGMFSEALGGDGPRATPSYSAGNIYALGAQGELRCLVAATGKLKWSRNILTENGARLLAYGVAASPLVVENKLIVLTGAGKGRSVVCYDKRDGKPLWEALDDVTGYSSPMLVSLAGQPQLLVCAKTRTVGLNLEDGKLLWEYPWHVLTDQLPITQPVPIGTNRFLLAAGYFTGCAAVEVTRTETGFAARTLWKNKTLKNKFATSVYWQGHIYGLDENVLTCVDAATGERNWKDGRYGYGQLLLASGHLVILSGEGELALVKATPDRFEELARFQAIQGKTWNYPAIGGGKLIVRNAAEMACFEILK
jgi:outer membrane protein assembly factor BamB